MMPLRYLWLLLMVSLIACTPTTSSETATSSTVPPFHVDTLQERTFRYFWDLAHPTNYQIPDRWPTERFSSIAATGFGLTAYLVGVERGYVSRTDAAERVRNTLQTLYDLPQGPDSTGVSGFHGYFYHFLTNDEALRYRDVELSSIDTGLLMAGVLSAQSYFDGDTPTERQIRDLAEALYRRVEWDWLFEDDNRLSMGYRPNRGFIKADWHGYNEAMILLVLAIGSPTHPIPPLAWAEWCSTYTWTTFQEEEHLNFSPLFGHQYSQMYIDFRGIQDPYMQERGIDYFENSRRATLANRTYCIENPSAFLGYGPNQWGLTACDGPGRLDTTIDDRQRTFWTYRARGADGIRITDDGTIAPTAAGGSVPFAPQECLAALEHMWNTHSDKLVGTYGFRDAFNLTYPGTWYDHDYLGIDQGPILIQMENHRSELVWKIMKRNPHIVRGLRLAGFQGGWLDEIALNE